MISEESCNTEDWSNYFWKFAITDTNYIWKYIKMLHFTILLHFDQINASLVSKSEKIWKKIQNIKKTI